MTDHTRPKCQMCASTRLDRGKLCLTGAGWEIRFKADGDHFRKQKVRSIACLDCGHIEFVLAELPPKD